MFHLINKIKCPYSDRQFNSCTPSIRHIMFCISEQRRKFVQTKEMRLQRIQHLAHKIMDEINLREEQSQSEELLMVVDNLSRALGELADPCGYYSLDYIEDKMEKSHSLLINKLKKLDFSSEKKIIQ